MQDIDQETALRKNPYIMEEEIPGILERSARERYSGSAREVTDDGSGADDGDEDRAADA